MLSYDNYYFKFSIFIASFFLILFLPFFLSSSWVSILITFVIYFIVSLSQDIVLGRAGIYNMGQAVFFGFSAYCIAILNIHFGFSVAFAFIISLFLTVLISLVFAVTVVRLRGDYLLITSLAFNMIFEQFLVNDPAGITNGPNGLFGISPFSIFGFQFDFDLAVYYLAFFVLFFVIILIRNLDSSRYGRALFFIKQDEIAAESVGVNVVYYKIFAFLFSSFIASLAGFLFLVQFYYVSPESFSFNQSIIFFAIVLIGGTASWKGIFIGTFVIFVLPEMLIGFEKARWFVFGIIMIITMIFRPDGILPLKMIGNNRFLGGNAR